jgi:hypothetical protein
MLRVLLVFFLCHLNYDVALKSSLNLRLSLLAFNLLVILKQPIQKFEHIYRFGLTTLEHIGLG